MACTQIPKRADQIIFNHGSKKTPDLIEIRALLTQAKELQGLSAEQAFSLLTVKDPAISQEIEETAQAVKELIYGKRLVLFAPLYSSNLCQNDCSYCAFRSSNTEIKRKALTLKELEAETLALVAQGHKRVLLVAGESKSASNLEIIRDSIQTIYACREPRTQANIRRVNVNLAPLTTEQFRELGKCKIGTFQLFQETYHPTTYHQVHLRGPKTNYEFRLEAMDRAMEAGIEDVGIGALFGLYDWRFEVLCLLLHAEHLENKFGAGPHTLSVPRIEPANGSALSLAPPHALNDSDFKRVISVLRLALPYTGLILSTRESPQMRRDALSLGISQISAGSKTNPGGYSAADCDGQFSVGDHRSLQEVIDDLMSLGHIPSFCTGCYRKGRVGKDFMELAKPGLIQKHCLPNALLTFSEYLRDFGDSDHKIKGKHFVEELLKRDIKQESFRTTVKSRIQETWAGRSDLYF